MSTFPNQKLMQQKHAKRREALDAIYEVMVVGEEYKNLSTQQLAETKGRKEPEYKDVVREIEAAGIIRRRLEYGTPANGMKPGRHFHWTVLVPKDEATRILDKVDQQELIDGERNFKEGIKHAQVTKRQQGAGAIKDRAKETASKPPEGPAIRMEGDKPVEAIVGPEPVSPFAQLAPLRKNESYALVEAARQYVRRTSTIDKQIESLLTQARDLGMTVDESLLRSSLTFDTDDRLEQIRLVLPYVDRLEGEIDHLTRQLEEAKRKLRDLSGAESTIRTLREQNARLLATRTTQAN